MRLNFDFVSLVGSKCKLRVIEFPQFYCLCLSEEFLRFKYSFDISCTRTAYHRAIFFQLLQVITKDSLLAAQVRRNAQNS